jgi:Rps23 Pro-64 3,4-dihydroxylase Tpa1-like proline 4-hydroxylase
MANIVDHECGFPDWDLQGAGLHEIPSGGHLRRHLDSDVMLATGWRRELSVVLFCNEQWQDDWGGKLIVQETEITPRFGQMVVFETNDESWHEVTPVAAPQPRKTLSLFYWSKSATAGKRPSALFA